MIFIQLYTPGIEDRSTPPKLEIERSMTGGFRNANCEREEKKRGEKVRIMKGAQKIRSEQLKLRESSGDNKMVSL